MASEENNILGANKGFEADGTPIVKGRYTVQESTGEGCLPTMNETSLKEAALANGGYETPELNDKLYLHFKGYRRIENLQAYTGLVSIWLDSNGFDKIEGLTHLVNLRSLFLQKNLIAKIEGVACLTNLVQIDLSENRIRMLSGLQTLTNLHTLNLGKNFLETTESVRHLVDCPTLTNIDMNNNELKEEGIIDEVLAKLPKLTASNFDGNPMVREVGNFRKKMVVACKSLRYLDRPIFDNERACSEAWAEGGYELERKVKKEWAQKKRDESKQSLQDFRDWQAKLRKEKEEEMKNPTAETLERRAKHQIFMEKTKAEAKAEAEEEKRLFADPDAARKAGVEFWNTSEQKDIFGNVRAKVQTPLELKNEPTAEQGEGETEEGGDNRGISKEDIFSFQGTAPGKGRPAQVRPNDFMRADKKEEKEEEAEEKPEVEEEDEEVEEKEEEKQKADGYDSEGEREMRVAESLQLYRAQQQAKKDKKRSTKEASGQQQQDEAKVTVTTMTATTGSKIEDTTKNFSKLLMDAHEAANAERKVIGTPPDKRAFYWSEAMDVKLAQAVHGCMFDFAEVSKNLQGSLSEEELGDINASAITEATCRDRWCELDMDDSVEVANHGGKPNIVLGKDGKQMSFTELQNSVNASSFLKAPVNLPGCDDDDEDSDGDEVLDMAKLRSKFVTNFETLD
eukprot:CAMPEP_0182513346 /NCGR_PEP_ID=MMETSP1321-20130603/33854_1 /TAXON_ID=91990 /ORGANISM="Bolidomonas sp., Strain RCC1657" /LENGTH=680 /DNA_ID=CAMNT_0024720347 /DNA_START=48 /DNA_END=2090 /DNA_ORIENTATION=+